MAMPATIGITPLAAIGAKPKLVWVAPTDLYVDATYQRGLSKQSLRLIRELVANFRWNRLKPPIVVSDRDKWHIVDGQHTAIAAATVKVPEIPVFVVEAKELVDRARAFVGHNTDRIVVSKINVYRALLAAGDPDAADVAAVCRRAGVTIREYSQVSAINVGDTKAVGLIYQFVKKRGVIKARATLETLVKAKLAPLGAAELRAADHILHDLNMNQRRLVAAIRVDGVNGIALAHAEAKKHRSTGWKVLVDRWLRRMKDRDAA